MTPTELKKWMKETGKRPVDIASATGMSIKTVERFLAGKTDPRPSIVELLRRLIEVPAEKKQS